MDSCHNHRSFLFMCLHNIIDIKESCLPEKVKIFVFPLAKFLHLYYSIKHREKLRYLYLKGLHFQRFRCAMLKMTVFLFVFT